MPCAAFSFSKGEDVLHFRSNFSNYAGNNIARTSRRTYFFLDRAIYRPGQTVYFKGVALALDPEGNPRILPDEEVTVTLYDVNRQEV